MPTESYDLIMHVCFEVRGKNLDAVKCNPLLREFRRKLEAYRFEEDGIKAWPARVNEFVAQQIDTTQVLCSQQITWTVVNEKHGGYDDIRSRLIRDMLGMKIENGERYNKKITIEMSEAIYEGGFKYARWPETSMFRTMV